MSEQKKGREISDQEMMEDGIQAVMHDLPALWAILNHFQYMLNMQILRESKAKNKSIDFDETIFAQDLQIIALKLFRKGLKIKWADVVKWYEEANYFGDAHFKHGVDEETKEINKILELHPNVFEGETEEDSDAS